MSANSRPHTPGTPCISDRSKGEKRSQIKCELSYLHDLLGEMRNQALELEQETLAYLIEMAMLEALQQDQIEQAGEESGDTEFSQLLNR